MQISFTPLINSTKQYNRTASSYSTVSFNSSIKKDVFIKSKKTNVQILSDDLKKLGFSEDSINNITKQDYVIDRANSSKECLKAITQDMPNIDSEELRTQYVLGRTKASYNYNHKTGKYTFNKKAFDVFNKVYISNLSLHNTESLEVLTNAIYNNNNSDKNLNFISANLNDDNNAILYLIIFGSECGNFKVKKFEQLKTLVQTDCDKCYLAKSFLLNQYPFDESFEKTLSIKKEYEEHGITSIYLLPAIENNLGYDDTKRLCDFVDEAAQTPNKIQVGGEPASDINLIELFLQGGYGKNTLRTIDIFGKDNFKKMFSEGSDRLKDYIANVGNPELDMKELQPLVKLVNPTGSVEYKTLEKQVSDLKQQLREVSDETTRQDLIKKINEISKSKNTIVYNSIKDPIDKGNAAMIYIGLIDDEKTGKEKYKYANEIVPFLNPKTEEEKTQTNNKLNDLMWKSHGIDCPDEIRDKFDFSKSKYLQKMFCSNEDFLDNFEDLVNVIKKYKQKNVADALDMLPQNVALKETFDELGLNYKKWTRFDPNLKLDIKVDYDNEKMQQNAITNLESEFNSDFFEAIPETQKKHILETLAGGVSAS